jgi:hypothetical protein
MERKTKVAIVVILCVILAIVILVILFTGDEYIPLPGKKNYAKDYILDELDGETVECTIEDEYHMCHLIYREDNRRIGEIWIYYYPGGIEPYKEYGFTGTADKMIISDKVVIFIGGNGDFLSEACDLYNEKFGFNCVPFERPER